MDVSNFCSVSMSGASLNVCKNTELDRNSNSSNHFLDSVACNVCSVSMTDVAQEEDLIVSLIAPSICYWRASLLAGCRIFGSGLGS